MIVTIHAPHQVGIHKPATSPKAPALVIGPGGEVLGTVPLNSVAEYLAGSVMVEMEAEADGDTLRIIGPARKHRPPMTGAPLSQQEAEGLPLLVYCNRCHHHGELPIAPLVLRFGRSYPIPDVAKHCRCSACGSKEVETRPQWRPIPGQQGFPAR